MHALPDCGLDDVSRMELEALDDAPSRTESFAEVPFGGRVDLPTLPAGARAFVARGVNSDGRVVALGVLGVQSGHAIGPLFRKDAACTLPNGNGIAARIPALVRPSIASNDAGTLLVGGRDDEGHARADAAFLAADSVQVTRLTDGLLRLRAGAAVLAMSRAFVVAGGDSDVEIWKDAETLDPTASPLGFDREHLVLLSVPRTEAGSVVLASGDGLLVGGRGTAGVLGSMEVIDRDKLTSRVVGLRSLTLARRSPKVLRFATGEIAVLGGVDAASMPVPNVEIYDASATTQLAVVKLDARARIDAVSLPASALLIVRSNVGDSTLAVSVVRPNGELDDLPPIAAGPQEPRFVSATDGSPFLWDGSFRRYDLWDGNTSSRDVPPATLVPGGGIPPFGLGLDVIAVAREVDRGFLQFAATRYDLRTSLASERELLGLGSTLHLSPDRHTNAMATTRGLELQAGTRVAITDTDYGAVSIALAVPEGLPPAIELRGPDGALVARVGDAHCPFPELVAPVIEVEVVRHADATIEVRAGSAARRTCSPLATAERVQLTLVAGEKGAHIRSIKVTRGE